MATSIHIESADQAASSAIIRHHTQLRGELDDRVAELREAVAAGDAHAEPNARVVEFIKNEILPHAIAEESTLYGAAKEVGALQQFVAGMLLEHRDLQRRAHGVESASSAFDALTSASGFSAVFAVHVAKENDVLLPALVESSTASLPTLLHDMKTQLAEASANAHTDAAPPPRETLDVRTLAHVARHEIIFSRLHALRPGGVLVIVNDHDPKPLQYQLEAAWPGTFGWEYLDEGSVEWRIAVTKLQ